MNSLSIICLNCFGIPVSFNRKLRFGNIADKILETDPDLVLLQEVWMKSDRNILDKKLSKKYFSYPKTTKSFSSGGLMTFSKNIDLENFEFHKFKNQPPITLITIPDRIGGKGFQTFRIHLGNKEIQIINAHLFCAYDKRVRFLQIIEHQLAEISSYINDTRSSLIVAGDLNLTPDDTRIIDFRKQLDLTDGLPKSENTIDLKNLNRGKIMNMFSSEPLRTDYILTNKLIRIVEEKVVFKEIQVTGNKRFQTSDHFGVFAKILC